jgi:hypothetical protein
MGPAGVRAAGGGVGFGGWAARSAGDPAFEFGAQAFGVVGGGADAESLADVLGA